MDSESFECFDLEKAVRQIAQALGVRVEQVRSTVELLDAGNTIPFIARYRKEATQGLDEIILRGIEDALSDARELAQRKTTILKTIDQQGLLTPELRSRIEACSNKQTLEDIYLPFKPKRRTRAMIARERGLQPLADLMLRQENLRQPVADVLKGYINPEKEVPDTAAAIQGACDIVAEQWSEDVPTRSWLTQTANESGRLVTQVKRGKAEEGKKFEMYFDYGEPLKRIPSHRLLAMKRGEDEGFLRVAVQLDDELVVGKLQGRLVHNHRFEFRQELLQTAEDCYKRLLLPAVESSIMQILKEKADEDAIRVFGQNLRELLLAPPAGPFVTIGIDPGFRTGCKLAVVDGTGKFLHHTTIYPTPPQSDIAGATAKLRELIGKFDVKLIAIGNGTASRETDAFVSQVLKAMNSTVIKATVSESGASIYSASELAGREFPDLDLTVRGAISIAHRLQDPLAELVKLDPKSIGVGQYQHDVNQTLLRKCLDREVESCVNSVGVDVNMASPSLLSHVAGIGPALAKRIVEHRDANGPFESRKQLSDVPKLGKKAFEQAAGFLRIRNGNQPLDNSSVHPESYFVVEKMAKKLNIPAKQLVGNATFAAQLKAEEFVDERVGLPTIRDILAELAKPGRDPRSEFKAATFTEGVNELEDLKPGMILEGVITNVTHFGAFVDIGVHQDGLIHISQLANQFVREPSEVVAVGDVVKVKVLEVDLARRRIAVSRKQAAE
ncbi:Tex family protein [Zavarzinella formosa]|uniref:Tex family protein n=1 Tax=Zavarzinella formosa TaxID=360055 RepID=UPI0002F4CCB4